MNTSDPLIFPPAGPLTLHSLEAFVLRWPVRHPVQTSFGTMRDRPALLVRAQDTEGHAGWGEVWCNFPACGAEHRANLLQSVIAPLVLGQRFESPQAMFAHLEKHTAVLAIQSGEPGPLAQTVAGADLAVWDLLARRAAMPLWQFLGGHSDRIEVYASGINPDRPQEVVAEKLAQGYRAFKIKLGFGQSRDMANVERVRAMLPAGTRLMADANQAWTLDEALDMCSRLRDAGLHWLEEPLRADRPLAEWQRLATAGGLPLAAGENAIGAAAFERLLAGQALAFVQPDLAKWGGISGCLPVVQRIHAAGVCYCPHFLGAGLGLLASAHLLAARGRPGGMLEIDANENPLRTELSPVLQRITEGHARLGHAPGLGVEPDLEALRALCTSPA